jgi:acetyl-CoA synthetase
MVFKSNEIGKKPIITCMNGSQEILTDYHTACRDFSIDIPEYFNFGFDVVDAWARKDRNKLAMIWVNQKGEEKKFSFLDLKPLKSRQQISFLNMGSTKGIVFLSCSLVFLNGGSFPLP